MLRLVAYAHNGVQRFVVDRSEMLIGSDDACDIRLPYAGVGPAHAKLRVRGPALEIEDLGSRKGVVVNGERTRGTTLQVLDEIRLGSIALLVEDVTPAPAEPGEIEEEPPGEPTITAGSFLEHLAGVSRWVRSDAASSRTLESQVKGLLEELGGGVMFLFQGELEKSSIKFVLATEARWLVSGESLLAQIRADGDPEPGTRGERQGDLDGQPAWISFHAYHAVDRPYLLVVALPRFRPVAGVPLLAGLEILSDLLILGLVHHVGQFQPIVFGHREQAELTPAPGLVIGESRAMKRTLAQLSTAVDPPVTVLLRGEVGVGKELLAKSLHLSSPQRDGPFVVASCAGSGEQQLAADLFGAEVAGRKGTVSRDGKLLLADGGTLYLDDVDRLPLGLQSRLVRFLRSGEVEPEGGTQPREVSVRLVAASGEALEALVARDQFRIDLAHRLGQLTVEVPALRERREDLPLLIQAAINRCCHAAGKRVQGITVKALEALAIYDYPGNLPELENIVRRLVYLCPQGMPIDESMLPEAVRLATVEGLQPSLAGDLDLERLVASCERAAIREALHRTGGNKSAAARQLGLSRNGLAMKIKRLGLKA